MVIVLGLQKGRLYILASTVWICRHHIRLRTSDGSIDDPQVAISNCADSPGSDLGSLRSDKKLFR